MAINPSDLPTSTIGESAIKQSPPIHLWNVRVFVYYKSVIKNESSSSSSNVRNQLVVDGHRRRRRRRIEDKSGSTIAGLWPLIFQQVRLWLLTCLNCSSKVHDC